MQRVRMSLCYFEEFNWQAEVVAVGAQYADTPIDDLLLASIPQNISVHYIKALPKKWTSKLGLGSIALRSLWHYFIVVNKMLSAKKYDLIYFSTTQFPVCILGVYWQKRFGVPFVVDMQDLWHSEYYQDKPKAQRPVKHWFSYRLNKFLEPFVMRKVNGVISVSADYITELKKRYSHVSSIPSAVITFGGFEPDLKIAAEHSAEFYPILNKGFANIVYVGRGGDDMQNSLTPLFTAFKQGIETKEEVFDKLRFYFIGTSYAPKGKGLPSIVPLAAKYGIDKYIVEITDRISYYHTLNVLQQADALFIPGSDDPAYTASKIYPYLLTGKPLLAIFNKLSPAIKTLQACGVSNVFSYQEVQPESIIAFLQKISDKNLQAASYNDDAIQKHSAREMTLQQCLLFDSVVDHINLLTR